MSPASPRTAVEIFEAALDLPAGVRDGFLDRVCGDDAILRSRVESLLAAEGPAGEWMDGLAGRLGLAGLREDAPDLPPDTALGAYRLRELLGRGGMGAVYLAERTDGLYEKQVALKVLPLGLQSPEARRRFGAERRILARLSHPRIASLLDGGLTGDGTPWFAMELVDGRPLDEHCDARGLGVDARLDLFLQVCEAVAHAHRSLVVHRDLKPSNVLVDGAGQVKLLDFGIAKVLDDESDATRLGPRPMTPRYAAPELLEGGAVTTATDVYSLGVLLHELLTGVSPYGERPLEEADLRRRIREVEPPPASRRVLEETGSSAAAERARRRGTTRERLADRLRGDLDTIVATALRKDPERRYRSVDELAADLRRHRRDLPVKARPLTLGYRVGKFVRRHRAPVAASAVAALLAVAVGVLGAVHLVTTSRQARQIALERDKAERIRDFLLETFLSSDPNVSRGEEVTARELLDRGAARIERELAGQPGSQALLMATMADVYVTLALYDEARPLYERALLLHGELGSEGSADFAHVVQELALLEEQTGHYQPAATFARQAIELRRARGEMEELAHAHILLGRIHQRQGDLDTAEAEFQEAVRLQREHLGPRTEAVALGLNNLATLHQQRGELERAESMHLQALAIRRELYGHDNLKLMESLYNLGIVTRRLGRLDEAQAYYEEALELTARLVPGGYADDAYLHNGLGFLHLDKGEVDAAATSFTRALEISRRFLGERHPNVGFVLASLGHVRLEQGRPAEARPLLEESLSILSETVPEHPKMVSLRADLERCGVVSGAGGQESR